MLSGSSGRLVLNSGAERGVRALSPKRLVPPRPQTLKESQPSYAYRGSTTSTGGLIMLADQRGSTSFSHALCSRFGTKVRNAAN